MAIWPDPTLARPPAGLDQAPDQAPAQALAPDQAQAQAPAQARPPAGLGQAPGTPSQPFGFVFDANASSEVRPGAYAGLTGPFIMALGPRRA